VPLGNLCSDLIQVGKIKASSHLPASPEWWLGKREWRQKADSLHTSRSETAKAKVSTPCALTEERNETLTGRVGRGFRWPVFCVSAQMLDVSHTFWLSAQACMGNDGVWALTLAPTHLHTSTHSFGLLGPADSPDHAQNPRCTGATDSSCLPKGQPWVSWR